MTRTTQNRLPDLTRFQLLMYREWERHEVTELFVRVVNICEPDHPHMDENPWPTKPERIDVSWKKSTSNYHASCGPRWGGMYDAGFAVDLTWWNKTTPERGLVTIIHEATHIEEGNHTEGSGHNPAFWKLFAENVNKVIKYMHLVEEFFDKNSLDVGLVKENAVKNPNSNMVDGRMETVSERKEALSHEIEE